MLIMSMGAYSEDIAYATSNIDEMYIVVNAEDIAPENLAKANALSLSESGSFAIYAPDIELRTPLYDIETTLIRDTYATPIDEPHPDDRYGQPNGFAGYAISESTVNFSISLQYGRYSFQVGVASGGTSGTVFLSDKYIDQLNKGEIANTLRFSTSVYSQQYRQDYFHIMTGEYLSTRYFEVVLYHENIYGQRDQLRYYCQPVAI